MRETEFIESAREMVGKARWRHRGRKPWAVDCIGLIVVAAKKIGAEVEDVGGLYGREPWDERLRKGLIERLGEPAEDIRPGDIALIRWGYSEPSHVGIIGNHPDGDGRLSIIHCHNLDGVTEVRLAPHLLKCIVATFRPRFL